MEEVAVKRVTKDWLGRGRDSPKYWHFRWWRAFSERDAGAGRRIRAARRVSGARYGLFDSRRWRKYHL